MLAATAAVCRAVAQFHAWSSTSQSRGISCIRRPGGVSSSESSCQLAERRRRTVAGGTLSRCNAVVAQESAGTIAVDNGGLLELANSAEADWTSLDSEALYRVQGWGAPHFFVSPEGHACVRLFDLPHGSVEVDLVDLIEALKQKNVQPPVVIRFPDILNYRMKLLQDSFGTAILNYAYKSHFQGVFPVKCNHDRFLVEEVVQYGNQYQFGLEAGSKPELLIAMAKLRKSRSALLICNGYKDEVYIESIFLARQLGTKAFIVIEQMEELGLIIKCSKALGARPLIGVRAKLSTMHNGHWGNTGGDNGKFGLTVNELVHVVYTLRHEMMLDCLRLLHFHIGSQVPSISIIEEAMLEGSHLYCELALMGAPMGYIDVGGGLGVDYDGSKRHSSVSTNYTVQDYADTVVGALVNACHLKEISHPVIISESGRALASHYSVLVFEVTNGSQPLEMTALDDLGDLMTISELSIWTDTFVRNSNCRQSEGEHMLLSFYDVYQSVNESNYRKAFNDAKQYKLEAGKLFKLGCLTLEQRAQANALYDALCHRVLQHVNSIDVPEELQILQKSMAAVYHVNLSLFRSAPDMWAISQIFPIIPLQRLHEKPTVSATLADLTCDSDGKVEHFVGAQGGVTNVLPVHTLRDGDRYYLGLFLAGVYQESLGSSHNLFGTTNTVQVRAKALKGKDSGEAQKGDISNHENGNGYTIEHVTMGQTITEVLNTVHHNVTEMIEELGQDVEVAVADECISVEGAQILLRNFKCSLDSYTYLTS